MSELENIRIKEDWLKGIELQALFDILCADGGDARVAGGAVRNALMGMPASDVDLCTTLIPQDVVKRLEAAGHKAVPTGIDHGTVTAVVDGAAFEVTTLRKDIETDGRHAVVEFGTDWVADANRRDLTINGLYCDRDGKVYDYVDGYKDILSKDVRFIGDAATRIKEDSLRILRFFRFFAWYGGGRPDAAGLKACAAGRELLAGLSVERVWMELKKMLAAPDPSRAILWMRTTGILGGVLPETHKWGTDAMPGLFRLEQEQNWPPDALFRLMGMVRPDVETMKGLSKRLAFSNKETERMVAWADNPAPKADIPMSDFEKLLYKSGSQGLMDSMKLEAVHLQGRDDAANADVMLKLIDFAQNWQRPTFPLQGQDLIAAGMKPGPEMGQRLKALEEAWLDSGFVLSREELLAMVEQA
jgi:tRNA nucleotidyltransferase/poly(A) polymerase